MKKYLYTILLCISCMVALPFMNKKVFASFAENMEKEQKLENESENDLEEIYYIKPPEERESSIPGGSLSEDKESAGDKEPSGERESAEDSKSPEDEASKEEGTQKKESEKKIKFQQVDKEYFKDALFIGDSRTVGLSEYADLNGADIFADSGMSVYKVFEKTIKIKGEGKTGLEKLLKKKKYGKIYVMLGINELGYDHEHTIRRFGELTEEIRRLQPEAILFMGANLHVTASKSADSKIYNNKNINRINKGMKALADGKDIFYIDINEVFDDKNGNLKKEYTTDQVHVLGKYYIEWADWILQKGIVK